MTVPRALLLMLALLQASGLVDAMQRQVCEAECRNDGGSDGCTPGNDSPSCPCHCPSLQTQMPAHLVAGTVMRATEAAPTFNSDDGLHLSPDPREISHVPRRAG